MKRKKENCHPLVFAEKMVEDGSMPWLHDIRECEEKFAKSSDWLMKKCLIERQEETKRLARSAYSCADWLKYKQCYSITKELAEDLFSMQDLSFPLEQLHLPFPTIYIDFRGLELPRIRGSVPLGVFLTLDDVPYGEMVASLCSILTIGWNSEIQDYVFGGISFDFSTDYMESTLEETVEKLSEGFPDERVLLKDALLFAAYLSSAEPDITEDDVQKKIYRPSAKPKYSSIRKWDVGMRYMKEKKRVQVEQSKEFENVKSRCSPRPHIRKAHWHRYYVGSGRKETKVLWIAPVAVGLKEELPIVVRQSM